MALLCSNIWSLKLEENELFIKCLINKAMLLVVSGKSYVENNSHVLPSNIGKDLEIRYKDLEKDGHINHLGFGLEKWLTGVEREGQNMFNSLLLRLGVLPYKEL